MKNTDIKAGTKLEVEIADKDVPDTKASIISQLEYMDNDTAYILAPIVEGIVYPISTGTDINMYFISEGMFYRVAAVVTGKEIKEKIPYLKVRLESEPEKLQRRQFFRVECSVPVKFKIIGEDLNNPSVKAYTRDISGGGVNIASESSINPGSMLECELSLDDNKVVRFEGEVMRAYEMDSRELKKCLLGISFKKISDRDREAIVGFIFKEQVKLRKKGLI
ncbi:MAG TPA: flagellar brake protein [Clostridia bacterium]